MVYVRNQTRHLLAMLEVPGLRDLEPVSYTHLYEMVELYDAAEW